MAGCDCFLAKRNSSKIIKGLCNEKGTNRGYYST